LSGWVIRGTCSPDDLYRNSGRSHGKVKVVTDSTADIPEGLAAELGITIVPCNVHFGLETYRDGLDLSKEEFYARLKTSPTLPTTSAPAAGLFEVTYRELASETDQILSIHLASALSAIYNSACLGAEAVSDVEIALMDSGQASMGLGWLVVAAARAAQAGQPLAQIVALLKDMIPRVRLFAALDTLEYLQKGGRVGKAVAVLGTLLSIKPLVEVRDSAVLPLERVRTRRRSIQRLIELVAELGPLEELAVLHSNAPQEAQRLAEEISFLHPLERILIAEVGVIIGTHTGPNGLGVACVVARCLYRNSGN
jgi:DegV family protein with EDD domain